MSNETHIQQVLRRKYSGNSRYMVENVFIFRYDWESDFFVVKQNGYCYEFEIKISRVDYFNDFKKLNKHEILSSKKEADLKPHKFYYIMPKDLISVNDIPEYAGLMYIDDLQQITTVKEAPFIHKGDVKLSASLCPKFYSRWVSQRIENNKLLRHIKYLETEIENLKLSTTNHLS